MHPQKHLQFGALRDSLSEHFVQVEDSRQKNKVAHPIHDCLMSGFAMMLLQDPSLLAFQQRMHQASEQSNLKRLFQIESIPKDSQMRVVLDQVATQALEPIFTDWLGRLQRSKHLCDYRFLGRYYLAAVNGSEYSSSNAIQCPGCLQANSSNGRIRYHHNILQAVIVHPDQLQVLPLAPEAIHNTDGNKKQDGEINAAKRLVATLRQRHPKLPLIVTSDGLYSKQPFINALKAVRMSYIMVAKPDDHKVLFEWVRDLQALGDGRQLQWADAKKRIHRYRGVNQVPLNGTARADEVNFFDYELVVNGKVTYHNSWVTDIAVDEHNVADLVKGGRARWKIENETFNTLKNQGYHIEHNYGHGRQNLSLNFFVLNLLAFYMHQILELTDRLYQQCRLKAGSRKEFFGLLRHAFQMLLFRSWQHMLEYIHCPPQLWAP